MVIAFALTQVKPDTQALMDAVQPQSIEAVKQPDTPQTVTAPKEAVPVVETVHPVVETAVQPTAQAPAAANGPTEWMDAAGIAQGDRQYVTAIMGQESGWTLTSTNYLGCIGLGQACPSGNKAEMLQRCPDWETNGACQMQVWNDYAIRRYGSWSYAYEWKFCKFICYNSHTNTTTNKLGEPWW